MSFGLAFSEEFGKSQVNELPFRLAFKRTKTLAHKPIIDINIGYWFSPWSLPQRQLRLARTWCIKRRGVHRASLRAPCLCGVPACCSVGSGVDALDLSSTPNKLTDLLPDHLYRKYGCQHLFDVAIRNASSSLDLCSLLPHGRKHPYGISRWQAPANKNRHEVRRLSGKLRADTRTHSHY